MSYSLLDRLVHRVAFSSPGVQLAAAGIEDRLYKADVEAVAADRPVFIAGLARAGTTILLEVLHRHPALATHLYRDMPFVMAPLLWHRLSGGFRTSAELRERAHGDGLQVGFDSPEAFEEVIWRAFWPEKYAATRVLTWSAGDVDREARDFLAAHFRKIVGLRRPGGGRYLSKNNGNLARPEAILAMFPDAAIVVPVRAPLGHAASLRRQHRNFLARHAEDRFSLRYMGDIGHYEFGALHRPIAFPGLDDLIAGRDPMNLDYWLGYWLVAYRYAEAQLAARPAMRAVTLERLGARPVETVRALCGWLGLDVGPEIEAAAGQLHETPAVERRDVEVDAGLLGEAEALYDRLAATALQ